MPARTLAEELFLLAHRDDGVPELGRTQLSYGLSGAVLLDLALVERLTVVDGRIVVADSEPTGQPALDAALARIHGEHRRRRPRDWVNRLAKGLPDQVADTLVSAGVLDRRKDTVLWIFPRTRYPAPHGTEPPVEARTRHRLTEVVAGSGPVDARTAALCGLIRAVRLDRKVFRSLPPGPTRRRLAEISSGDWADAAVRDAVDALTAGVAAAVIAASAATTG